MFKWLNKQGVESDSGFVVQFTGRFTCEYRENGCLLEIEVEDGLMGDRPCVNIKRDVFSKWNGSCLENESPAEQQVRLLRNFKDAMEFQGLSVAVY
jgi:hypothetical protein